MYVPSSLVITILVHLDSPFTFPLPQDYFGERSEEGKRDGKGKAVLPNRNQYEGEYCEGQRYGSGVLQYKNGARYEGEWKKGSKHGTGKLIYPDGSWYDGAWKYNKKHGFGKYSYESGDIYEGAWHDDLKHGVGSLKFKQVEMCIRGTWVVGELKGPIEVCHQNYRYHGYWNKTRPVGEGAFTFGMKFMIMGQVEMMPDIATVDSKTSGVAQGESEEHEMIPSCQPVFIARDVQLYDYCKLPQQPIQLPQADSVASFCTESSSSVSVCESDDNAFQVFSGPNASGSNVVRRLNPSTRSNPTFVAADRSDDRDYGPHGCLSDN